MRMAAIARLGSLRLRCVRRQRPFCSSRKLESSIPRILVREALIIAAIVSIGGAGVVAFKYSRDQLPLQVDLVLRQARLAQYEGDYLKAIKLFERARRAVAAKDALKRTKFRICYALAACHDEAGHQDEADNLYAELAKSSRIWDTEHLTGDERHELGIALDRCAQAVLRKNGDIHSAIGLEIRALAALCSAGPGGVAAAFELDIGTATDEHYANAIIQEQLVKPGVASEVAGVLNNLGILYLESGSQKSGIAVLRRALAVCRVSGVCSSDDIEMLKSSLAESSNVG